MGQIGEGVHLFSNTFLRVNEVYWKRMILQEIAYQQSRKAFFFFHFLCSKACSCERSMHALKVETCVSWQIVKSRYTQFLQESYFLKTVANVHFSQMICVSHCRLSFFPLAIFYYFYLFLCRIFMLASSIIQTGCVKDYHKLLSLGVILSHLRE